MSWHFGSLTLTLLLVISTGYVLFGLIIPPPSRGTCACLQVDTGLAPLTDEKEFPAHSVVLHIEYEDGYDSPTANPKAAFSEIFVTHDMQPFARLLDRICTSVFQMEGENFISFKKKKKTETHEDIRLHRSSGYSGRKKSFISVVLLDLGDNVVSV